MTESEILQAALNREKEAYAFYNSLLEGQHVEFLRDLLTELRDQEGKHRLMIERHITDMNLGRG
jgi:rubrerythrin